MEMNIDIIIAAAGAALVTAVATWLIVRGHFRNRLKTQEILHEKRIADMEKMAIQAQENYDKALKSMRETVVASMTAETEKLLRQREKELADENQTSMDGILKPLKESISAMEKAMKENASSHLETSTKLSEQLKQAVQEMQEKTSDVGR
jgi:DNA anti-recombination protein RmuC